MYLHKQYLCNKTSLLFIKVHTTDLASGNICTAQQNLINGLKMINWSKMMHAKIIAKPKIVPIYFINYYSTIDIWLKACNFCILWVRQSVISPPGLNSSIFDNFHGFRQNIFDQSSSHIQRTFASLQVLILQLQPNLIDDLQDDKNCEKYIQSSFRNTLLTPQAIFVRDWMIN